MKHMIEAAQLLAKQLEHNYWFHSVDIGDLEGMPVIVVYVTDFSSDLCRIRNGTGYPIRFSRAV